jgi:hypothetical protein
LVTAFALVAGWHFFVSGLSHPRCIDYSCSYSFRPGQILPVGVWGLLVLVPIAAMRPVPRIIRRIAGGMLVVLGLAVALDAVTRPYPPVLVSSPYIDYWRAGAVMAAAGLWAIRDARVSHSPYAYRVPAFLAFFLGILLALVVWFFSQLAGDIVCSGPVCDVDPSVLRASLDNVLGILGVALLVMTLLVPAATWPRDGYTSRRVAALAIAAISILPILAATQGPMSGTRYAQSLAIIAIPLWLGAGLTWLDTRREDELGVDRIGAAELPAAELPAAEVGVPAGDGADG